MSALRRYRLAPYFVADHISRDLPEQGSLVVIAYAKTHTTVELDAAAYHELLGDADFYADPRMGFGVGLRTSARATAAHLRRCGPPS